MGVTAGMTSSPDTSSNFSLGLSTQPQMSIGSPGRATPLAAPLAVAHMLAAGFRSWPDPNSQRWVGDVVARERLSSEPGWGWGAEVRHSVPFQQRCGVVKPHAAAPDPQAAVQSPVEAGAAAWRTRGRIIAAVGGVVGGIGHGINRPDVVH